MRFNKSSAKPRATMETHKRSASTSTTPVKKIRLSPVRLRPVIASLSPRVMEHMRVFRTTRRRLVPQPASSTPESSQPALMSAQTGHFRLQGSPKRKNYQPRRLDSIGKYIFGLVVTWFGTTLIKAHNVNT